MLGMFLLLVARVPLLTMWLKKISLKPGEGTTVAGSSHMSQANTQNGCLGIGLSDKPCKKQADQFPVKRLGLSSEHSIVRTTSKLNVRATI